MSIFEYSGKGRDNNSINGIIEANTEELAADLLEDRGIIVLSIKERESNKILSSLNLDLFNSIPLKDVVIFTRQLSVMMESTLPIVRALKILLKQTENVNFRIILSEVLDDIEGGTKLSLALSRHPAVFSSFYVNMIKSGETSGKLSEVLLYLADQLEKDYDIRNKIKGAMIYPAFIFIGLIIVGILMMVFVIPKITDLVRDIGAELPLPTRILISVSDFIVQYGIFLFFGVIVAIISTILYIRTEEGRRNFSLLKLKLPIFGKLYQRIYLVQFTRSLSTLIVGKVPLTVALKVVSGVVDNDLYKEIIDKTIKEVEDGNNMSNILSNYPTVIPSMLTNMLSVGEQTGRIHDVLNKMTKFYTREIDNLVANIMTLIEPIIIIIMGLAVAIMVAAILLPTFNLASQL